MSDASLEVDEQATSVGTTLRNARVAADWTLAEAANKLNLTPRAVESLETEQFDRLPGMTFARGYIRSYAKILGLDADQLAKQFDVTIGSGAAVKAVQTIDQVGELRRMSRGILQFGFFIILVVVLAGGYYAWQTLNSADKADASQSAVFDRVEVERADGSMHVQTIDEPEDQALALSLAEPLEPVLSAAVEVGTDESAESALNSAEATTAVHQSSFDLSTLVPGTGVVEFSFENECWLRVLDGQGKEISSGLKRAGERVQVVGKLPLDIHLGYAKGVTMLYNGEPFDFSSSVRGETARVKLGQ